MAKYVISLEDKPDGSISVKIEDSIPVKENEESHASVYALALWKSLAQMMKEDNE